MKTFYCLYFFQIRCFEFLTRPGVPQAPQLYAEVGRAGLQHLAELEKFLRREPPVHGVFVGEGAERHVQEGGAQQVEEAIVQQVEEAIVQPEGVPHAQHEAYREEPVVQPEALGDNQPAPIHDQVPIVTYLIVDALPVYYHYFFTV